MEAHEATEQADQRAETMPPAGRDRLARAPHGLRLAAQEVDAVEERRADYQQQGGVRDRAEQLAADDRARHRRRRHPGEQTPVDAAGADVGDGRGEGRDAERPTSAPALGAATRPAGPPAGGCCRARGRSVPPAKATTKQRRVASVFNGVRGHDPVPAPGGVSDGCRQSRRSTSARRHPPRGAPPRWYGRCRRRRDMAGALSPAAQISTSCSADRRSDSGSDDRNTPAMTTSSAAPNAAAKSCWNTLRHDEAERGSNTAHTRRDG